MPSTPNLFAARAQFKFEPVESKGEGVDGEDG